MEASWDCLTALCAGNKRWGVHIPPQEDDPDLAWGAALHQLEKCLAALTAVTHRAEAAETIANELRELADRYGQYCRLCGDYGEPPLDFCDWGHKGEPDTLDLGPDSTSREQLLKRAEAAERLLAAVPEEAIERYFEHSDTYRDVLNGKYEAEQGRLDCHEIAEWLALRKAART